MSKLPRTPRVADLVRIGADILVLSAGTRLRRVYFQGGAHPSQWDSFRVFGPVRSARFDHHHLSPPALGPRGVLYAALGAITCLAEVFQVTRRINTTLRSPWLASFALARDVSLLDLSGAWPTRAGGSMAIDSGPRGACRAWSRAIYEAYPDVDGLFYCSSMHANRAAIALYDGARTSCLRGRHSTSRRVIRECTRPFATPPTTSGTTWPEAGRAIPSRESAALPW